MNKKQIAQVNMFTRMKLFFGKYAAILTPFAALAALIAKFNTQQALLQNEIDAQGIDTTGVAQSKDSLKTTMLNLLIPMARKARVWAKANNNSILEVQFDIVKSSFDVADTIAISLAENLMTALNANAAALLAYNITAAQLTAAGNAVTAFKNAVGTPQQQANALQVATTSIVGSIKTIADLMGDVDDLLIPEFAVSQANMVAEYENNRRIGNAATHHTNVVAHIYNDVAKMNPITGASISIDSLNRSSTSNKDGKAEIVQFKAGDYSLTVKATNHIDQHISFSIKGGKHVELDVVMSDGRVVGAASTTVKPVANANVTIAGTNFSATTDSDGKYSFMGVPAGSQTINIATQGGDSGSKTVTVLSGEVVVVDFGL